MSWAKPIKQSSSEEFVDNQGVRVLRVKINRIITTIISIISAGGKLWTTSLKVTLLEDG